MVGSRGAWLKGSIIPVYTTVITIIIITAITFPFPIAVNVISGNGYLVFLVIGNRHQFSI
jgi:hypothetical protein